MGSRGSNPTSPAMVPSSLEGVVRKRRADLVSAAERVVDCDWGGGERRC